MSFYNEHTVYEFYWFFFKGDTLNNVLFLTSASLQVCLHTCVCTFIRLLNAAALLSTSHFVEAGIQACRKTSTNYSLPLRKVGQSNLDFPAWSCQWAASQNDSQLVHQAYTRNRFSADFLSTKKWVWGFILLLGILQMYKEDHQSWLTLLYLWSLCTTLYDKSDLFIFFQATYFSN